MTYHLSRLLRLFPANEVTIHQFVPVYQSHLEGDRLSYGVIVVKGPEAVELNELTRR